MVSRKSVLVTKTTRNVKSHKWLDYVVCRFETVISIHVSWRERNLDAKVRLMAPESCMQWH